jgi:hypothetical protein
MSGRQANVTALGDAGAAAEQTLKLQLAVEHFQGLALTPPEARGLAEAIVSVIGGNAECSVGPLLESGRRYRFARRGNAVHIRVGKARIHLSFAAAKSLARQIAAA